MPMKNKKYRAFFHFSLLAVILYFVGKKIIQQGSGIHWDTIKINYMFLILAVLSDILSKVFSGILFGTLLSRMNSHLPYRITMSISWLSLLGKYIPGKIAVVGSAIYLLSRYKVRSEIAAVVPVLANGMVVVVCIFLSIPLLTSPHKSLWMNHINQSLLFLILIIGIIMLHPKIFFWMTNELLRRMKRHFIENEMTFKRMLIPYGVVLIQCVFSGMTTWYMIKMLTMISTSALPMVISISVLAGTLGFLAFFSPAGIGVREGIYLLFLSPLIGSEMAALTVVCLRFLQTIIDVSMAMTGIGLLRLSFLGLETKDV